MRKVYTLLTGKTFAILFLALTLLATTVKAQTDITIGTGTTGNVGNALAGGYPCPVQDYYEGNRTQFLYLASELQAAGMGAGVIDAVKFNVLNLNSFSGNIQQYTMQIGTTSTASLSTGTVWEPISNIVYGPVDYVPSIGINVFTFTTPFVWNGVDNIVIEICNGLPANTTDGLIHYTQNPTVAWTSGLPFNASHNLSLDNTGNLCGNTSANNAGTQTTRSNIIFSWTPATACAGTPVAGNAQSTKLNVCANEPFTLSLSGATLASGLTYQWESSTDNVNWTPISGATTASYPTSQTTTKYYHCVIKCTSSSATATSTSVQIVSPALISGTFTINSGVATGGTNFQTFAEAISSISCGINGPVVFNVAPASGPYPEQIVIPQIGGASATNTVTINGNGATLQYSVSSSTANRAGILLNGADYIRIDSLIIDGSSGAYNWGIILTNQADNNIIRHCSVNVYNLSSSSTNFMGIVINGSTTSTATSGNNGSGNIIDGNTVIGGYYSIHIYGNSAANNTNNTISNNKVIDPYGYGIYTYYQTNLVVSKNEITRPSRSVTGTMYCIYLGTSNVNCLIEKNIIHNLYDALSTNTSTTYCMYVSGTGIAGQENKYINNLIYNIGGNGTIYGIYNTTSPYMQAYHNTISLDDASASSGGAYGIYQTGTATGITVKNNIVSITRSGTGTKRCLYYSTTTSTIVSNNNALYMGSSGGTSNVLGQFGTTNYNTLTDWKTANSNAYDQVSQSTDPLFVNPGGSDYKPSAVPINDIGANVGVTTDIVGVARTANPDPGAYEFSIPPCTNPAVAGAAIASVSNTCALTPFTLDLVGNSVGSGQTYQWQSSPNNLAPWTNVGPLSSIASASFTQTTSLYYRCAVTCGTGTTVYSTSVQVTSPPLVTGTFTINSGAATGGTNFHTFGEAVSSLSCGIGGPIVFNVVAGSGPYNEQVTIPQIGGTSAVNTITFNGNGASIVYNSTNTNNRAGILLNGADYIVIDSLTIDGSAGTYAWGIILTNQADNNIIRRCTVNIGNLASTSSNYIGIMLNGSTNSTATSGNNGNGNLFDKNIVNGGYYGIYVYGNSAANNTNNTFTNNKVLDNYAYAFYVVYQSGAVFRNNDISRPARTSSTTPAVGIYLSTSTVNILAEKNRIHNMFDALTTNTSTFYGIYAGGTGAAGQEIKLINNLIYNPGGNGAEYGIYNSTCPYMLAYHNTISLDDVTGTNSTAYGIYQTGTAAGISIKNNIISVTRTGTGAKRCLYYSTTGSTIASNNNVLYMGSTGGTGNFVGQYGTTNYATLANWQTANTNAYDQQSISLDPVFATASTGNYTPTAAGINNIGTALGVTTDITGATRDLTNPDPGAYEISVAAGINMAADALIAPAVNASGCYTNAETITVRIRNTSISPIDFTVNPVTLTVNVTGAATQTLVTTINTGSLPVNGTLNVSMATPLDMSAVGTYTFNASTAVAGDINTGNDAMAPATRTKVAINPGTIASSPPSFCITPASLTLTTTGGTGYSTIQWQQSPTAGSGFTNISGGTTSPYTLSTPIPQSMYFHLVASCGTASATSPDIYVPINNPQLTATAGATRCGPGPLTLTATGSTGTTLNWYTAATGGVPVYSGGSFVTPSLNASTTYYVAASQGGGGTQTVGAPNLSIGSATVVGTYYLNFTVLAPTTIQSVECYFTATLGAAFVVNIRNAATSTSVFTYSGAVSVSSLTTPQVIPLGATLSPGDYQIGFTTDPGTNRTSTGASYPYTIPGVLSITGNTFNDPNYYYYFYHWTVLTGCESARTAVIASVAPTTTIGTAPSNQSVCPGGNATFNVNASGGTLTYQWRKDGVNITGATSSSYTVTGATSADLGNYDVIVTGPCDADTTVTAALAFNPVTTVTGQPVSLTKCAGDSARFTVTATGTGSLTYQWRKNGSNITGATTASMLIFPATAADAADYDVVVTGTCGTSTSSIATLTVNPVTAISTQPTAQTTCAGSSVSFTVGATGTGTLLYQWRKGGIDITGANSSTYTISAPAAGDAGSYDVVITGTCGAVTSSAVTLTVNPITAITTQPAAAPQLMCIGSPISFSIIAAGVNLTYQWRKGGTPVSGATSSTYTINSLVPGDAGTYDVVVTGTCGSATSNPVTFTVSPAGTWTGAVSSDWNSVANWCGGVPTASSDIVIPSAAPNMPNLSGGAGAVKNLTINNGASMTIGANGVLDLYGNISGAGTFTATSGSINFKGATSQAVPAFTATNVTVNGAGGVVLGGNTTITGTLTLTNGQITLGANNLTLSSSSTGSTASHIITDGTGSVITTNVTPSSTRTIPVGANAASYNPVLLSANAGHTADNFTVKVKPGVFINTASGALYTDFTVDRTWIINEGTAGGSNVDVTLQWSAGEELPKFDRTRSYVMQPNAGGTAWVTGTERPSLGTNPYTQTKTGVTSFSSFAVQKQPIPDAPTGIFPNPVATILNIVVRPVVPEHMTLSVYDMSGKLLLRKDLSVAAGPSLLEFDVKKLNAGMYILKVSTDRDREFLVRKFLKVD